MARGCSRELSCGSALSRDDTLRVEKLLRSVDLSLRLCSDSQLVRCGELVWEPLFMEADGAGLRVLLDTESSRFLAPFLEKKLRKLLLLLGLSSIGG